MSEVRKKKRVGVTNWNALSTHVCSCQRRNSINKNEKMSNSMTVAIISI